jgi:hypothetical protein
MPLSARASAATESEPKAKAIRKSVENLSVARVMI